ncbi:MAG: hypothetical protein M1835_006239, partial [Candelina submexicana]
MPKWDKPRGINSSLTLYPNSSEVEDNDDCQPDTPQRIALRLTAATYPDYPRQQLFKDYGYSKSAGYRILARPNSHRQQGSGRLFILDDEKVSEILAWIQEEFDHRAATWDRLISEFNLSCSWRTLQRPCHRRGYYRCRACWNRYLKPELAERRVAFATEMLATKTLEDWKNVDFSDETHLALCIRQFWITRMWDERHEPDCQQYKSQCNPTTLHYWAAVGWDYKSALILYWDQVGAGNMDMDRYIEILESDHLSRVHEARAEGREIILEEDNDFAHGTRSKKSKVAK